MLLFLWLNLVYITFSASDLHLKVKEGERFQLKFDYYVQREIVSGLKYVHRVGRMGIRVAKETFMIGSYGPAAELKSFTTPWEHAPSGKIRYYIWHFTF